ncbi:MAG: heavy-metal-associated domain-containing protein, partial [Anaerolineae bacterium]|nr:heavy-metal-associated domain-containing protein [Anaerolineae bacterium]
MASEKILEVPVKGMDCAECVAHVQHAIAALPGVQSVDVFLSSEKAVLRLDPAQVSLTDIRDAVANAGYSVPESAETASTEAMSAGFTRSILSLFGVVFGAVLLIVIAGEGLGLFESIT